MTTREALRARVDDPDLDTCLEALAGLARRCEKGLIRAVARLLVDADVESMPLGEVLNLADPMFHRALARLAAAWAQGDAIVTAAYTLKEAAEAFRLR